MFETNRQRIAAKIPGGLLVIAGYKAMQLSGDMSAPFVQEANFFWLTGIEEPGWRAILDLVTKQLTLVRPHKSDIERIFDGELSDEAIKLTSGAHQIITEKEFETTLRQLARRHTMVYTVQDKHDYGFVHNPAQKDLTDTLARIYATVEDCSRQFAELRAVKQPAEITRMQQAINLTIDAFTKVRANLPQLKSENQLVAEFDYVFRRANASHAYEPIAASGAAACTLHYIRNDQKLHARQGVLIDIGARVDGYSADITRTYFVNPTKRQIAVHAAVERAHHRVIDLLGPHLPVQEYNAAVDEIMKDAMQELGLLADRDDQETYRRYFPHAISHGLGIDPHDPLGSPRCFMPGMVVTVEPGIYIPEEGISVRIEDDILITDSGHRNLSSKLPTYY